MLTLISNYSERDDIKYFVTVKQIGSTGLTISIDITANYLFFYLFRKQDDVNNNDSLKVLF